jgi:hypothetical protein
MDMGRNPDRHGDGRFVVTIREWLVDVEMKKTKNRKKYRVTSRRRWQRIRARVETAFPHDGMPEREKREKGKTVEAAAGSGGLTRMWEAGYPMRLERLAGQRWCMRGGGAKNGPAHGIHGFRRLRAAPVSAFCSRFSPFPRQFHTNTVILPTICEVFVAMAVRMSIVFV